MDPRVLAGTEAGLFEFGARARVRLDRLAGLAVAALARDGDALWVLAAGRALHRLGPDGAWAEVAHVGGEPATCLAPSAAGVLIGTAGAHLLRLEADGMRPVASFEGVEGRDRWFTPWGDPPDVRSIAVDPAGHVYVNVHVGGVVRSRDGGGTWQPTLDIEVDVHQVLAHARHPGLVAVATAVGLGLSRDGGDTWRFETRGLHATYLRAVAFTGSAVLVSAASGPGGRRAALYRRPLDGDAPFERCAEGLPEWFTSHVDTGCLVAAGDVVAAGTGDGEIYLSGDGGDRWWRIASGLPGVRCLVVD